MTANRKGRRPGNPGTADEILRSARDSFASLGYERASVRGIARAAGVDPALVLHYFGSKQHLFVAAVELPYDVGAEIGSRLATAPETAGEGLVRMFLLAWDDEHIQPTVIALLRAAATDDAAAGMLRQRFMAMIHPLLEGMEDAGFRASLCSSQMLGLGLTRYVLQLEPLASADHETIVRAIGPTIQRYLTAPELA
jgi:AcrR family transcriptional regulator